MNNGSRWWYKGKGRLDRTLDDIKAAALVAMIVLLAMAMGALLMMAFVAVKQFLQAL